MNIINYIKNKYNHIKKSTKYILFLIIISLILLVISYISNNKYAAYISYITLCITFIIISTISFMYGFIVNILLFLFILLLLDNNLLFLSIYYDKLILSLLFFVSAIIIFLITAYNIPIQSENNKNKLMYIINKYELFFKLFLIFIQYILLLFIVLISFSHIYSSLNIMLNEGVKTTKGIINNFDTFYFSVTTFFTIGFGDIIPNTYAQTTKILVIFEIILGHLFTTVLWPIVIIFAFNKKK